MTTLNLDAVLNSAKKTETKPKSKIPILPTPVEIRSIVTQIAELVGQIDSATAEKEAVEAELLRWASRERESLIARQGFVGSVKVEGLSEVITLSWQDKYSKIDLDNLPLIQTIIGETADAYFTVKNDIKVKSDATDEELAELIALVGADKFSKFFEVSRTAKPTSRYTLEKFTAFTPEQRQQLDLIVRQYKPSVKTK